MGSHSVTLRRRITELQLDSCLRFCDIDDQLLDMMVEDIQRHYPKWGEKCLRTLLFSRDEVAEMSYT